MSSQPRTEPNGSKARHPLPSPAPAGSSGERRRTPARADDVLASPPPSSDDTPTIISRNPPAPVSVSDTELTSGVRGRRLAHFELIEPIGVGGMAAVLRARDTQLDRFVALKILPPEMSTDIENVRRFHQEARSAAKLDHENIARVFFCGEDQRLHFIAFEFVEGENLRAVIERRGRLPVGEALHYMLQVAAGLAHAAQRGVVHRDIKPSNIIVTPSGRAKLVDMGLARSMERKSEHDLTQSGVTLGTFDYISPEQALEPREADVRSDIYSLGCTFYHVLTGRPAVPEGTAARKLHCHQHVKPPDPRQYVPDLPVEVVLILDRMMAKNPRDRFQTPEELVHRLLVAARKLGVNPEVPEGVLAFEAAVPAPPAGRPLVWLALAAVAVVLLVLFIDPTSSGPSGTPAVVKDSSPVKDKTTSVKDAPAKEKDGPPVARGAEDRSTKPPAEASDPIAEYVWSTESTEQRLLDWLVQHRNARHIRLLLAGDLDLSWRDNRQALCLLLQAREKVTIRPLDKSARPPTIRLTYKAEPATRALVALTVDSPASEIEGIRFVVDSARTSRPMAALHLRGGKHRIRRCEFIQARPDLKAMTKENRLASVVAEPRGSQGALVALQECVFLGFEGPQPGSSDRPGMEETLVGPETGGQDALVLRRGASLTVTGCVFGPHAAALRLEQREGDEQGKAELKHCSVLLPAGNSAVFDVQPTTSAQLTVSHCLFSRLGRAGAEDQGAVLIRQAEDAPRSSVVYQGNDNCYHDLDGYWVVGDDWKKAGWSDFKRRTRDNPSRDSLSRIVLTGPWEAGVDEQLRALKELKDVREAFRPNLHLKAVRETGASTTRLVGAEAVLGERLVTAPLPDLEEKTAPSRRVLVVEKDKDADDSPNGVYPSLDAAVGRALPGDTILVRHDGALPMDPVVLNKKNLGDLTIRPARWFRPVIVPGEISEPETALFRVQDGKLVLERLEFRLPSKRDCKTLTVLALAGNGVCELRDCLVTLERSGDTTVALASLSTLGAGMRLEMPELRKPDEGPRLLLERCFVRGDGDLLHSRASRPCELEFKDSLAALAGTFLHLDVNGDGGAPKAEQKVNLLLKSSTTYLGGHLVRLAGKDRRGLIPVRVTATKCLFVPAGSRALVQLDMPNTEEKSVKDKFSWDGSDNAYGGYTMLLAQNPGGEEMAPLPIGVDKWKQEYPGEDESKFGVKLAGTISSDSRFPDLEPGSFRPREALKSGVKTTALPEPRPR